MTSKKNGNSAFSLKIKFERLEDTQNHQKSKL